jgi:predicted methyltransferase
MSIVGLTTMTRSSSAPAALFLLAALSACSGLSPHGASTGGPVAPAPSMGVTERMPSSEGVPTRSIEAIALSPEARAVVDAEDRADEDRAYDRERRPAELLTFLDLKPGVRTGVLVAGTGYTAELLARAVAPSGTVYAENPRFALAGAEKAWASRLGRPAMKTVVRVDRELDDPFPPEATDLDLVVINLVYHDTVWMGIDRERMNKAVLRALRQGGKYVVIDHSARPGTGFADVRTLHRVEAAVVSQEVESAGFQLENEGAFLRNTSDTRDWNDSPEATQGRGDTSDRFVLMFSKP